MGVTCHFFCDKSPSKHTKDGKAAAAAAVVNVRTITQTNVRLCLVFLIFGNSRGKIFSFSFVVQRKKGRRMKRGVRKKKDRKKDRKKEGKRDRERRKTMPISPELFFQNLRSVVLAFGRKNVRKTLIGALDLSYFSNIFVLFFQQRTLKEKKERKRAKKNRAIKKLGGQRRVRKLSRRPSARPDDEISLLFLPFVK